MVEQADASSEPDQTDNGAFSHGSLGRLAPTWWEPEEDEAEPEPWLAPDEALDRFLEWVAVRGIELWPHQEEALMDLMVGDHVILGTPTGSGKSLVALGMHFMALATGRRAYYTAPIKALVSEKFFDLVDILGRENVGMITGDAHINAEAPVICCTAEILANQALREGEGADVGCVAMDEFHFYGDADRGWAWQVPLLTLPKAQFLLMSATLGDVSAIAVSLEERTGTDVDVVADAPRPVPLDYEYVEMPLEGTVELALRKGEAPLYLVHFSQDAALATAQALSSYGVATKEQREQVKEAVQRHASSPRRSARRSSACWPAAWACTMRACSRATACWWRSSPSRGSCRLSAARTRWAWASTCPSTPWCSRRSRSSTATRCAGCAPASSTRSWGVPGASGFDTEGMVIAEAPEHDIENAKLVAKAGDDPKKLRKIKKKQPPEGFVHVEQADLRAPDSRRARDAEAAHEDHALHGAVRGGAGRRRVRSRAEAHSRLGPDRRGEGGALGARRRDIQHAGQRRRDRAGGGRGRRRGVRDHGGLAGGLRARPAAVAVPAWRRWNFWTPRARPTRSTSYPWPKPRWRTRGRYCAPRSARRATRPWPT